MKTLYQIMIDQKERRENYAAARALGILKDKSSSAIYKQRLAEIQKTELKEVGEFISSFEKHNGVIKCCF